MKTKEEINLMQKQGKRLRMIAHDQKGLTNIDLAEILNLNMEKDVAKTITSWYSGKHKINDRYLERLADLWELRPEYLKCLDDWPTLEDALQHAGIKNADHLYYQFNYFKQLGFQFVPGYYKLDILSKEKMDIKFKRLSDPSEQYEIVRNIMIQKQRKQYKSNAFDEEVFCFKMLYNDKEVDIFEIDTLQECFTHINAIVKAAMTSLFVSDSSMAFEQIIGL